MRRKFKWTTRINKIGFPCIEPFTLEELKILQRAGVREDNGLRTFDTFGEAKSDAIRQLREVYNRTRYHLSIIKKTTPPRRRIK